MGYRQAVIDEANRIIVTTIDRDGVYTAEDVADLDELVHRGEARGFTTAETARFVVGALRRALRGAK